VLLLTAGAELLPVILTGSRDGEVVHLRASDIGDRRILAENAVDFVPLLQAAVDIAPGSIIAIDELGSILTFNPSAEAAFGYDTKEVIGRNVSMLMSAADAATHDAHLRRHFHTGKSQVIGGMRVVEARRKNGELFPVELYLNEARVGDRRLYVAFLRDISHRREMQAETSKLQRELIHVTRLASMGEMAAAIAHELNQPLTAIAAYAETARMRLDALVDHGQAAARDSLAKVSAQALRAGDIIRHMRQLAAGDVGQRDPEKLNAVVREAVTLATIGARTSGVGISIVEDPRDPVVICDRIQIQQVIINLVRNAMDAFDDITAVGSVAQAKRIDVTTRVENLHAVVTVRDTGPGVPAHLRERLFETFLTTKAMGVGLGLPVSRMIIESHGGRLFLDPSTSGGAEFRLTLPLQQDESTP
jgi:two-component system sensor kinase FixL